MQFSKWVLLIAAPVALLLLPRAMAVETDCIIHDPSTIVKQDKTYWVFGTGVGCPAFSSPDRLHWKFRGPVFATAPDWVTSAVPKNKNHHFWAPDIRFVAGKYCLYYSVSTFGSNVSAIGLATSKTLDPPAWKDQGTVVRSARDSDFNAIDPAVTADANGGLWLTFGSFWSGIQMIALDPTTGKPTSATPRRFSLAAHPQDPADSIEAAFIYYHQGYYYLFVNWDYCCRKEKSTYNIRVGRSRSIIGPYRDKEERDMRSGGGTSFLEATTPTEVGPGHAGIFSDSDGDWFSCHYEWARSRNGAPVLNLRKLRWASDGWPSLAPDTEIRSSAAFEP